MKNFLTLIIVFVSSSSFAANCILQQLQLNSVAKHLETLNLDFNKPHNFNNTPLQITVKKDMTSKEAAPELSLNTSKGKPAKLNYAFYPISNLQTLIVEQSQNKIMIATCTL